VTSKLIELAVRRGELKAKIEMQRTALAQHARPLAEVLSKADRVVEGIEWLKRHPGAVGAAVAAVAVARPRRTWNLAKRGFFLWQSWRALRRRLQTGLG
jgi:hypothetical protein